MSATVGDGSGSVGREGVQDTRPDIAATPGSAGGRPQRRGGRPGDRPGRRRRKGGGDRSMVPEAEFTSYYGRPIVKPSPWESDIPAYLFAGGVAAGSSLIAAGADLTGRPSLRRTGRLGAIGALSFSMVALVHDLGRPSKFLNMLRVAKLTSPMSVGTWILSLYGPFAGAAAATELVGMLPTRYRVGPLRLAAYVDRPACSPPCSRLRSPPTPRSCSPTPPRRRGTRPTASCRSSSSAPPRPPPPGSA